MPDRRLHMGMHIAQMRSATASGERIAQCGYFVLLKFDHYCRILEVQG